MIARAIAPALVLAAVAIALPCGPTMADEAFEACLRKAAPDDPSCGVDWLSREEARLVAAWGELMEIADGDIAARLETEQQAWEGFRAKACAFKLDEGFGGAAGPHGYHACLARLVRQRVDAIEAYYRYIDN